MFHSGPGHPLKGEVHNVKRCTIRNTLQGSYELLCFLAGSAPAGGDSKTLPPIGVMVPVAKLSPLPLSHLNLARNQIGGRFNPISIPQVTQVTLNIRHFNSKKHRLIIQNVKIL